METNFIVHRVCSSIHTNHDIEVNLVAEIETGKSYLELRKTAIDRYPITDYAKVMERYEQLRRSPTGNHLSDI